MLSSLVLSTTYRCPIQCRHCGAECSPQARERLTRDEMISFVDQVHAFGRLQLVVFTGGEPFLLGRDLLACVEHCAARGLATRIVTNAFWARTRSAALRAVRACKEAGLTEINLSCDDYHQEFIPLERIRLANEACRELQLPCLIGHKVMKGCRLTPESLEAFLGCPLARFRPRQPNPPNDVISTGYTVPIAEDMHLIPDEDILYPEHDEQWKEPCASVLQRVIITPRKELSICCGMIPRKVQEVFFGPLDRMSLAEAIVLAHQDLIVNWLAFEGPYGLMRFIRTKRPELPFRARYVNVCHLCSEILTRPDCRQVLAESGREKALEISLHRALYDFVRTSPRSSPAAQPACS